jgi:hypothetical protein
MGRDLSGLVKPQNLFRRVEKVEKANRVKSKWSCENEKKLWRQTGHVAVFRLTNASLDLETSESILF